MRSVQELTELKAEFSLRIGVPSEPEAISSLNKADEKLHQFLRAVDRKDEARYDKGSVMESPHWWYIPYSWIGCSGFIVEKNDGAVNWLGSAHRLRHCFWGHNHRIWTCDTDFTLLSAADIPEIRDLLCGIVRQGHHGIRQRDLAELETGRILSNLPGTLRGSDIWLRIPIIEEFSRNNNLTFTAKPGTRVPNS